MPPCSCLRCRWAPAKLAFLHALQTAEAFAAVLPAGSSTCIKTPESNRLTVSVSASYTACCLCLTALMRLLSLPFCMYCSKKHQVQQLSCLCLMALERLPSLSFCMHRSSMMCSSSCLAFVPLPCDSCQSFSPNAFS